LIHDLLPMRTRHGVLLMNDDIPRCTFTGVIYVWSLLIDISCLEGLRRSIQGVIIFVILLLPRILLAWELLHVLRSTRIQNGSFGPWVSLLLLQLLALLFVQCILVLHLIFCSCLLHSLLIDQVLLP
jgi:hypothetical protein